MNRTITITEGLAELKLLDARINKAIEVDWVSVVKTKDLTDDFKKKDKTRITAAYKKVTDLIAERNAIKAAIVASNAKTIVRIGGREMTVAEALEHKSGIQYEKNLLAAWKRQFSNATEYIKQQNNAIQTRLDVMIGQIAAGDKPDIAAAQKALSEEYIKANGVETYDPLDLKKKIEELDERIDTFEASVDIVLSVSNAITTIEI